jgi:hypothetical protein
MALEASCTELGERAVLRLRQSGWEDSRRWSRYYEILASNLTASLDELKRYVESRP